MEINELADQFEKENKNITVIKNSSDVVNSQQKKDFEDIANDLDFQKASREVNARDVREQLREKALAIKDKEVQHEWDEYLLKKKKEQLDYKIKKEKRIIKTEITADVKHKKIKIAEQMYGHLYEKEIVDDVNEKGEKIQSVVYKDFSASTFINRYREFSNWYKSLSAPTKKIVKTSLKFLIGGSVVFIIITLIVNGFKWLLDSGILAIG